MHQNGVGDSKAKRPILNERLSSRSYHAAELIASVSKQSGAAPARIRLPPRADQATAQGVSGLFASQERKRASAAGGRQSSRSRAGTGIRDLPCGNKSVPDEENHKCPDSRGDKAGSLLGTVMADCLSDEGCEQRTYNAKHGCENKSGRIVRTWREQARYDARDEADHDNPNKTAHCLPPLKINKSTARKLGSALVSQLLRGRCCS